jgi:hypothetical protein
MVKDYRATWGNWFERHAGLGGWVGAVGAILAIFAAWLLARAEYLRTQHIENERVNTEINLISKTASQFDPMVQQYIKLVQENDATAKGFYNARLNDPRRTRMVDFNTMPVTQWPSVEAYDAFKEYFIASTMLMETSGSDADKSIKESYIIGYSGKLEALQKALNAARR